jgi:hypothetical protein
MGIDLAGADAETTVETGRGEDFVRIRKERCVDAKVSCEGTQ